MTPHLSTVDVRDQVARVGVDLPPADAFWRLGDATALRLDREADRYYRLNYERGPLLYALVASRRPRTILEIGTARGYSTLCMAWALHDVGINGRIYTVDCGPATARREWAVDWHDGQGPHLVNASRAEVWAQVARREWLGRIETLHGRASGCLGRWRGPRVDLAYIDGGHAYDDARHDLYSILPLCSHPLALLFDDYDSDPRFGVGRLVDSEVAPRLDCTLITNDAAWSAGPLPSRGHGMVWATGQAAAFDPRAERAFLAGYRLRERLRGLRRRLRQLLPT
ncbi:MAG: class I SAM-dependent methyltransferase [Armatimonadetes bacterium]|nr:class I SAM-dependent methyltransferase [Armatimonadota bacterium]